MGWIHLVGKGRELWHLRSECHDAFLCFSRNPFTSWGAAVPVCSLAAPPGWGCVLFILSLWWGIRGAWLASRLKWPQQSCLSLFFFFFFLPCLKLIYLPNLAFVGLGCIFERKVDEVNPSPGWHGMEPKKIACFIWSSSVTGRDVFLYRLWQPWVGGIWWPPNLEGSFLPSQKKSRLFTWSKIQNFPFNCKCSFNGGDCFSHSGCPSLYRVISGFLSFFVDAGAVVSYLLHFEGYKSLRGLGEPEKNFVKKI